MSNPKIDSINNLKGKLDYEKSEELGEAWRKKLKRKKSALEKNKFENPQVGKIKESTQNFYQNIDISSYGANKFLIFRDLCSLIIY